MPEEVRPKPVFTVPLDESQTECAISGERLEAVLDSNDVSLPACNASDLLLHSRIVHARTIICSAHHVRLRPSLLLSAVVA